MFYIFKKLFITISLNSCLFLFLIVGIQNSSNKSKVDLLIDKTVELPVGFILGLSFISGSITGSLITSNFNTKKFNSL
tara:strand:- start:191 stop:424 length:234 start_codon:yes stop_codon:yes gene_type:complete